MILSKIIQIIRTGFTIISIIWGTAFAATINVSTVTQLENAVATANSSGGNTTILMQDGVYTLNDTLYINAPAVTITSQSGNRENVIIQGDAMSSTARVGNVIRVAASSFKLDGITLQKSRWHLIQIAGERNADNPIIRNCIFRDAYEQMLKVSVGNNPSNPSVSSDNGLVENCLFEYSAEIGPQYYIGGIDVHGAKNWTVRNNTFRNIISPSSAVAEFAIHFWNYSANNTIEKNLIMNCDRGIGFGLAGRPNNGGVIRNNMIYHTANKGQFADTAIALTESPNTQVYNNTIFMENGFPWAIEYRFSATSNVLIANNLTNKPIQQRDSASGTITDNVTNASGSWFVNRTSGDLHLASAIGTVIDMGQSISGLSDDFDGHSRPQGGKVDIGADEFVVNIMLQPPQNLRLVNP